MIKLGLNIDHVATLRQARGSRYPNLVRAALIWTEVPDLMELSAEAMDAAIAGITPA